MVAGQIIQTIFKDNGANMMPMPKIDWDDILIGYNAMYGKQYRNPKEMMYNLYLTMGCQPIENMLGISHVTILTKLREFGFPIRPRGGKNHIKKISGADEQNA